MLNYVELIGRLVEDPQPKTYDEVVVCNITLAVERPFKNSQGKNDTDFIKVSLWDQTAKACGTYSKKGDTIYVRGRIQVKTKEMTLYINNEPQKKNIQYYDIVGERVLFLHYVARKDKEERATDIQDIENK